MAQALIAKRKRRSPQGELRNLTTTAREKLHGWFREKDGTLPYHEIARRLKAEFDMRVGLSTLSDYYNEKAEEIAALPQSHAPGSKTIVIRIEVPPGCAVNVSTEEGDAR